MKEKINRISNEKNEKNSIFNMFRLACLVILSVSVISCKAQKGDANISNNEVNSKKGETITNGNQNKDFIISNIGDTIRIINKSEEEWAKQLSKDEFYILRKKGTERAFTGDLLENKNEGLYTCAACNLILFRSNEKFESGTGWPSFWKPADDNLIRKSTDYDLGYPRTEVMCGRCGGHLGHVFDDGPKPTGLRYCLNSVSLNFVKADN